MTDKVILFIFAGEKSLSIRLTDDYPSLFGRFIEEYLIGRLGRLEKSPKFLRL
jgi:hypothetical protein